MKSPNIAPNAPEVKAFPEGSVAVQMESKSRDAICEDAYVVNEANGFAAVFDGAGGEEFGAEAANAARDFFEQPNSNLKDEYPDEVDAREAMARAFRDVNSEVKLTGGMAAALMTKRTTVEGREAILYGSVGDCSLWLRNPEEPDEIESVNWEQSSNGLGDYGVGNVLENALGKGFNEQLNSERGVDAGVIYLDEYPEGLQLALVTDGVAGDWDGNTLDETDVLRSNQKPAREEIAKAFTAGGAAKVSKALMKMSKTETETRKPKVDDRTAVVIDLRPESATKRESLSRRLKLAGVLSGVAMSKTVENTRSLKEKLKEKGRHYSEMLGLVDTEDSEDEQLPLDGETEHKERSSLSEKTKQLRQKLEEQEFSEQLSEKGKAAWIAINKAYQDTRELFIKTYSNIQTRGVFARESWFAEREMTEEQQERLKKVAKVGAAVVGLVGIYAARKGIANFAEGGVDFFADLFDFDGGLDEAFGGDTETTIPTEPETPIQTESPSVAETMADTPTEAQTEGNSQSEFIPDIEGDDVTDIEDITEAPEPDETVAQPEVAESGEYQAPNAEGQLAEVEPGELWEETPESLTSDYLYGDLAGETVTFDVEPGSNLWETVANHPEIDASDHRRVANVVEYIQGRTEFDVNNIQPGSFTVTFPV